MIEIPLKLKFRNPNVKVVKIKEPGEPESGTLIWMATRNKPNPGAQVNGRIAGMKPKHWKTVRHIRPRRKSYGPF